MCINNPGTFLGGRGNLLFIFILEGIKLPEKPQNNIFWHPGGQVPHCPPSCGSSGICGSLGQDLNTNFEYFWAGFLFFSLTIQKWINKLILFLDFKPPLHGRQGSCHPEIEIFLSGGENYMLKSRFAFIDVYERKPQHCHPLWPLV